MTKEPDEAQAPLLSRVKGTLRRLVPIKAAPCGETVTEGCIGMGLACCDACDVPLPTAYVAPVAPAAQEKPNFYEHRDAEGNPYWLRTPPVAPAALTVEQRADLQWAINLAEQYAPYGDLAIERLRAMLAAPTTVAADETVGRTAKKPIMRFNIIGNLINPDRNGLYVRYEDHVRHVAPAAVAPSDDTVLTKLLDALMMQNIETSNESYLILKCVGVPPTETEFVSAVRRTIERAVSKE